jgi:hypothetical protein
MRYLKTNILSVNHLWRYVGMSAPVSTQLVDRCQTTFKPATHCTAGTKIMKMYTGEATGGRVWMWDHARGEELTDWFVVPLLLKDQKMSLRSTNKECLGAMKWRSRKSVQPAPPTPRVTARLHTSHNGTGMIHPRTLRPPTFCPRMIRPRTLFPNIFTSLYFSSLNKSQPTELHQPCIGLAFSLTQPNHGYGQLQLTEFYQPMNRLGI